MWGKEKRILLYTIFLLLLLLSASKLVLLIPWPTEKWGRYVGITDTITPLQLEWSSDMQYIGVYGYSILNSSLKYYSYYIWNWNMELPKNHVDDPRLDLTFRLYNTPHYLTDVKWSSQGTYIAETANATDLKDFFHTFSISYNGEFMQMAHSVPDYNYSTLAWTPDETEIYLATYNNSLYKWSVIENGTVTEIPINHPGDIVQMEMSPSGSTMYTIDKRNDTFVLSISSDQEIGNFTELSRQNGMFWAAWTDFSDGEVLLFENGSKILYFDPITYTTRLLLDDGELYDEVFASRSRYIGYARNTTLHIFDVIDQQFLKEFKEKYDIQHIDISPDERYIAYILEDGIYVRKLNDFSLYKYLPPGYISRSFTHQMDLQSFRILEIILVSVIFGLIELQLQLRDRKAKIRRIKKIGPILYPED